MDVQRVILIAALALVSYLMVLQWNEDYGPSRQPEQRVTSSSAYSNDTVPATSDLPQPSEVIASADIPRTETATEGGRGSGNRSDPSAHRRARAGDRSPWWRHHSGRTSATQGRTGFYPTLCPAGTKSQPHLYRPKWLVGPDGPDANAAGRPLYSSARREYTLEGDNLVVDLKLTTDKGVEVTKRFTFHKGEYRVGVEYLIDNPTGEPFRGVLFGQIKRDGSADPSQQNKMGMQSYLGAVFSTAANNYQKVGFGDMDDERFKATSPDGWVAWCSTTSSAPGCRSRARNTPTTRAS